jgi:hypothetical protein
VTPAVVQGVAHVSRAAATFDLESAVDPRRDLAVILKCNLARSLRVFDGQCSRESSLRSFLRLLPDPYSAHG